MVKLQAFISKSLFQRGDDWGGLLYLHMTGIRYLNISIVSF